MRKRNLIFFLLWFDYLLFWTYWFLNCLKVCLETISFRHAWLFIAFKLFWTTFTIKWFLVKCPIAFATNKIFFEFPDFVHRRNRKRGVFSTKFKNWKSCLNPTGNMNKNLDFNSVVNLQLAFYFFNAICCFLFN